MMPQVIGGTVPRCYRQVQQRWGWGRHVWVGGLFGLLVLGSGAPVGAQVTYTVFPAKVSGATVEPTQPTRPGAGSLVTLVVQDSTLDYVISTLANQAHLRPVYNNGNPLFAKRVTVHVVDANVMDAFATVLQGTGLVAKLRSDDATLLIGARSASSPTEHARVAGGIIAGHVTDSASGAGLGGASVRVDGTKISAVTSDSGHFTLKDVPPGDQVLTVRLFGYRPAERTVTVVDSQRTMMRITMVPVSTVLSGVVTTATGLQRKVEVGNDITSLNVDSIMQVAPITSVTDLLETRVPGLTVLHSSGAPGDPSRIRVRGVSSITGSNDPVVMVDGVRVYASQSDTRNNNLAPSLSSSGTATYGGALAANRGYAAPSPLDQIDPASIETIEVFKGPSASALYGPDAASGVIVITTKHGRAGPTHWNLALGQGVNWLPGRWPTNWYRFGTTYGYNQIPQSGFCQWSFLNCALDSVVPFQALNDPRYTIFSHGTDQTAALTVSGGVPTLQYSLTGSAAGDMGNLKLPAIEVQRYEKFYGPIPGWMVRPDNYQTWGVSGQLTAQPTSTARVTLLSSLFNSTQQRSSLEQAISQLEGMYIDTRGNAINDVFGGLQPYTSSLTNTPLLQNEVERATAGSLTSTNALTLTWQPYAWLPLTATGGLNTMQRTDQTLIPFGINVGGPANTVFSSADTTGSYGLGRGTSQNKTLTVGTSIPTLRQRMTLAVGANLSSQSTADFTASTTQLAPGVSTPTTFPTTSLNGTSPSSFGQSSTGWSTYGWYVEPRLNISSRFFAAPGFRLDGGSASGTHGGFSGTGLSGFPKIDFSWLAVDQSHPRGLLTLLRPRLAFGYAGTQPGPTEKLRLLSGTQEAALNDSMLLPSVEVTSLGNTALRPETSRELEGGVDAELWHGRFTLTWTQYDKTRYNAIISLPVAPSVVGDQMSFYRNVGEVRNAGTEVTVNAKVLESRALSWHVGADLSNDNNRVVRLDPSFLPDEQLGIVAGYPLFSDWARPIVAFADRNHNGIVDKCTFIATQAVCEVELGDSLVYVGQAEPKYQINLTSGLTLFNGRISVNATFAYQRGLTQINGAGGSSFAVLPNKPGTSLATEAAVVAATGGVVDKFGNNISSDIGLIQTVNTFRFNDLSINATLPRALLNWLHVPQASLALQGSNLMLRSNYQGKDPGVNAFATVSAGDETIDLGQLPQPRVWWLKFMVGH